MHIGKLIPMQCTDNKLVNLGTCTVRSDSLVILSNPLTDPFLLCLAGHVDASPQLQLVTEGGLCDCSLSLSLVHMHDCESKLLLQQLPLNLSLLFLLSPPSPGAS